VIRLLLSFLDDPQSPQAALDVISTRTDLKFVQNLLAAVGTTPSRTMAETLTRLKSFAWAQPGHPLLTELTGTAQQNAVALWCASVMERGKVLEAIGCLLLEGKPAGRRAAAEALAHFQGAEADALAVRGLNDEDPEVRAQLILQLRPRKVPGALSLLIRLVDSPHDVVRDALRTAMPEFTFKKFLSNFDAMDEELRSTAGHLVRKIDVHTVSQLAGEMESLSPVRRRRAASAAAVMGLGEEMEGIIIKLLSDEDHMVRIAAAKALADCKSMPTWEALRDALLDRSVIVRETAEASLSQIFGCLTGQPIEETAEVAT
jgi:HEAT repeat protein